MEVIYYNKKGTFSSANAIEFDRNEGTLKGIEPGYHEVVAICYSSGTSSRRSFNVTVNYPKAKSINILTGSNTIYNNTYIPLSYEIIDEMGVTRDIDYWKSDNAERYFSNLEFSITSDNNKLEIDDISNLSVNETLSRTLITSVTTLLALFSIFILGGEILKGFSFAMILGVIIGTYSSIFVASPILKYLKVSYKTLEKKEDKISP